MPKETTRSARRGDRRAAGARGERREEVARPANERLRRLIIPHPERLWDLFFAFEAGESLEGVAEITRIDPWFLDQIQQIVEMRAELKRFSGIVLLNHQP